MGSENQDAKQPSEVTVVVNIKIKPGCKKDYDECLGRFLIVLERSTWLPRNNRGNKLKKGSYRCDYKHNRVPLS
jgi:hypothetical protein